jgi:hypothetical protein
MVKKRTKSKTVSKDVGILGRFIGVQELKSRKLIKLSKTNKNRFILTIKGRKELSKKRKQFPFVSRR